MATNGVGGPVDGPVNGDDGTQVYSEIGPRGVGGAEQGGSDNPYSLVGPDGSGEHVGVPVQSGGNGPQLPPGVNGGWRDRVRQVLGGVGDKIDPQAYQRLLGRYNHNDIHTVEGLPGFKVRHEDNTYIYRAPMSPSTKLVIMLSVFMLLLVVAFAVLAILSKLGILHLPVDWHVLGIVLASVVAAGMFFVSGFFLGVKAGEYKKYSEIRVRTMLERNDLRRQLKNVTDGLRELGKIEDKVEAATEELGKVVLESNIQNNTTRREMERLRTENTHLRAHLARVGGTAPDVNSASEQ
ncbi:hypothetical protein [Candidatus Ichthyocystis sparus]|uniref:hypothetical protein n=1 Tax=Candidatus Ichthyocystis sparus TaxID=1561004 RepID=UPI000B815A45|nr:hypothetical protein [Candidatus Ichthyocystis sparus]